MKKNDLIYIIGPCSYNYIKGKILDVKQNGIFSYQLNDNTVSVYIGKDNLNGEFDTTLSMHTIFLSKLDVIEYYENKINKLHQEKNNIELLVATINLDK